jgi:hypothetical protein
MSDMEVIKYDGFWGQGSIRLADLDLSKRGSANLDVPAGQHSSAPEPKSVLGVGLTPLGRLEYILDPDAERTE